MKKQPKGYEARQAIRHAAFAEFLRENSDVEDNGENYYIFVQGFMSGQLHEIENSTRVFRRIARARIARAS